MPRTRRDVDRESKVDEILAIAERQLLAGGFAALSLAAISREIGVAQNAVYWYFPSRDDLFVGVVRKLVAEFPVQKPSGSTTVGDRAVWIVNRLVDLHPLIVAMRERAGASEAVAELVRDVEAIMRGMIVNVVSPHIDADSLEVAVDSYWATIEGVLLRQLPRRRREAVVRFALERVIGAEAVSAVHA